MIGKNVLSKKPVSITEVKGTLAQRSKDGELGFEQKAAFEYCEKFAKLPVENMGGMLEDLAKFEALDDESKVKIMDVLPEYPGTLKAILQKSKCALSEEEIAEVLKISKKYRDTAKGGE